MSCISSNSQNSALRPEYQAHTKRAFEGGVDFTLMNSGNFKEKSPMDFLGRKM